MAEGVDLSEIDDPLCDISRVGPHDAGAVMALSWSNACGYADCSLSFAVVVDGQVLDVLPLFDPDADCDFKLGSGGKADVANVESDDESRWRTLLAVDTGFDVPAVATVLEVLLLLLLLLPLVVATLPCVPVLLVEDGGDSERVSFIFKKTSSSADVGILMLKKNSLSL